MPTLAENIKQLRKSMGLTQSQLAENTGLSMSAIRSYENGVRKPNYEAMATLENYFHVTGNYLRGETNSVEPTYAWEDTEIMDSVKETFPSLIQKLLNSFSQGSAIEQKMLFDILVELCHIASTKKDDPSFRTAAFQLMQENFVHTTRFIDFCKQFSSSSDDAELKRLESFSASCSEDFDNALFEFQCSLLK